MVRAEDRESLVRLAASTSAGMLAGAVPTGSALGLTPWAIADLARTSIAWGTFAHPPATAESLVRLANAYANVEDEFLEKSGSSSTALTEFVARTVQEQFPLQLNAMPDLARAKLLFDPRRLFPTAHVPEVMTGNWFEGLYGYSLDDFLTCAFLAHGAAMSNHGMYNPSWLRAATETGEFGEVSFAAVEGVFYDHLAMTVDDFKIRNRLAQDRVSNAKKKFAFNPLRDRPFITGLTEVPIAPLVHSIMAKVSPSSIYYQAIRSLGEGFGRDLGHVFEDYVGDQLRLLGAPVHAEIAYTKGKNQLFSTDWFVELDDWLLLVECKSARPVESVRLGEASMLEALDSNIGKAVRQVNRSHLDFPLINARQPSLAAKPHFGLVVTLEPFFINNNPLLRDQLESAAMPLAIASAAELEALMTLSARKLNCSLTSAAMAAAPSTNCSLNDALKIPASRGNPLIEAAFAGYSFMEFLDGVIPHPLEHS
jgi:hypothetical protein